MSLPKISPCRCGHTPELLDAYMSINGYFRHRYYIYCPKCGNESLYMETRIRTIKVWNHGQSEGKSNENI